MSIRTTLSFFPFALCALLTGCTLSTTAPPVAQAGLRITGAVHGGQQAVAGAAVYLYAANTNGYGNASVSLLNGGVLANNPGYSGDDSNNNYYVTTDTNGAFSISSDYTCVSGQQVYLYAVGGNAGGGANAAAGFLAVLGNCPGGASAFSEQIPHVVLNEVSTIAAAYAMAGFATDATHVSSSGTLLAQAGIANAFANAANLVNQSTGLALSTTPAGNGTAPQATVNTLANILSSCVNSSGAVTGPTNPSTCYTLFNNALSDGSTGTAPSDTATAAINIAHYPGTNVANLYAMPAPVSPFVPALAAQPTDLTLGINFTGGGLTAPAAIAIDDAGNAWIVNRGSPYAVTELSSTGAPLSGPTGFTGGNLEHPNAVSIDQSGNIWITNVIGPQTGQATGQSLIVLNSSGSPLSGSPYITPGNGFQQGTAFDGYGNAWVADSPTTLLELSSNGSNVGTSPFTGGGMQASAPGAIGIDGSGSAWIPDVFTSRVTKFSNSGAVLSGPNGFAGGGLDYPLYIAMDGLGNAWLLGSSNCTCAGNGGSTTITKLSNSGASLEGANGLFWYGLRSPSAIAIDGSNNVWIANYGNSSVNFSNSSLTEFSNSGSILSTAYGYTAGGSISAPQSLALDGSGDAWLNNPTNKSVTELIGVSTPVITPIAAGLPLIPTTDGTSKLGSRP